MIKLLKKYKCVVIDPPWNQDKVKFLKESLGKTKTCFIESSSMHSVKPDSFYRKIAEFFEGSKIDIFARQKRKGFDGWGNEYGSIVTSIKRPNSLKRRNNNNNNQI